MEMACSIVVVTCAFACLGSSACRYNTYYARKEITNEMRGVVRYYISNLHSERIAFEHRFSEMARGVPRDSGHGVRSLSVLFDARPGEGHHIGERLEPRNLANSEPAHVVDAGSPGVEGDRPLIVN